jgi:predicted esterase
MKILQIVLLNVLLFSVVTCANKQSSTNAASVQTDTTAVVTNNSAPDSFPTGKIIEQVVCKNNASQSYALYIPSNNKTNAVIYFFDPHSDGTLPLKNYKALADAYNFILIGSNNSKNGNDWQTTENIWQNLFNDTQSRLTFNRSRVYACGFSGGAKVASYIALHHTEIKAVIAGGAGLPDETPAGNFNFSFTGIAGKGDMNMTDLVALNNDLDKTPTKHRVILFNGKHEWSPANTMNIAFAGLEFDAMRNNVIPKNDSLVNRYISNSKKRIDSSIKKNDWIQASNECTLSVNMLDGIADANWFKEKDNSIINNPAYKNQLQQQQGLFTIEQNKKAEYNAQFQQGDMNYWNKTINDLNTRSKATTAEGAMYQRLLAYLSLAFYSISNQLINSNQNKDAGYFVTLYTMADPTNSEAWYFSSLLDARNNNATATTNDLLKAVANGFNDEKRMLQQPEFQTLQPPVNFNEIETKMKN